MYLLIFVKYLSLYIKQKPNVYFENVKKKKKYGTNSYTYKSMFAVC